MATFRTILTFLCWIAGLGMLLIGVVASGDSPVSNPPGGAFLVVAGAILIHGATSRHPLLWLFLLLAGLALVCASFAGPVKWPHAGFWLIGGALLIHASLAAIRQFQAASTVTSPPGTSPSARS